MRDSAILFANQKAHKKKDDKERYSVQTDTL